LPETIFFRILFTEVKTDAAYAPLSEGAAMRYSAALVGPAEVSDANEVCSNSMDSATKAFLDAQDDRSWSIFGTETRIE
jgi:hypothetical protein